MKFKPYNGKNVILCDAMVGVNPNSRQPQLIRCRQDAVGRYYVNDDPLLTLVPYLCQNCFEKISEADKVNEPIRQKLRETARQVVKQANEKS